MYIPYARKLLQAFEHTQADMLLLDLEKSRSEFLIEVQEMRSIFAKTLSDLAEKKFKTIRDKRLLTGQLEKMLIILKEMSGHLRLKKPGHTADEGHIIFIFYRQHLFKNIYRRHLSDYVRITGG